MPGPKHDAEFQFAKQILARKLQSNSELTSFKISKGDYTQNLDHSFICLKNVSGDFEYFRMEADILGKGMEGKVKIIENEAGEKYVVKVSAAPNATQITKAAEELEMMQDVGLLLGQFVRQREVKRDKVLNKEIGDKQYTLQQYIPGKELAVLLKEKSLSEMERLKIFREILACANDLHDKSILHRDIKPENMIVSFDSNGEVQDVTFIDYGCSIKLGEEGEVVKPYAGSPKYMAPEIGRDDFFREYAAFNKLNVQIAQLKKQSPSSPQIPALEAQAKEQNSKFIAVLQKQYTFDSKVDMFAIGVLATDILKLDLQALGLDDLKAQQPADRPSAKNAMQNVQQQINVLIAESLKSTYDSRKNVEKKSEITGKSIADNITRNRSTAFGRGDTRMQEIRQKTLASHWKITKPSAAANERGKISIGIGRTEPIVKEKQPNPANEKLTSRKPAMVRMKDLHKVDGKNIAATSNQMAKLKQFQKRGLKGFFEIEKKEFLIDDAGKAYAVYKPLGKGGLGTVYLVQDLETEKWHAAKTSGDKLGRRAISPQVVRVMQKENEMLADLGQLVGVISAFRGQVESSGVEHAVSIQKFAYGEEYFEVDKKNPTVSAEQAVLMSLRLFEELADLHARGILHLDIKPENMKWDSDFNRCKILDMGCSVKVQKDKLEHKADGIIGTIAYHPPEIQGMLNNTYSDKGDVFAAAKSVQSIVQKADNLNQADKDYLDDFLQKALDSNPQVRPTAAEARDMLFTLAQVMHNDHRLSDVNVAMQTAERDLNVYISQKLTSDDQREALQNGLKTWMSHADQKTPLQEKIEIAKSVVDTINNQYGNSTPSNLTEAQILIMVDAIIQARVDNIDKPDTAMEAILKKSCDATTTQLTAHFKIESAQKEEARVSKPGM